MRAGTKWGLFGQQPLEDFHGVAVAVDFEQGQAALVDQTPTDVGIPVRGTFVGTAAQESIDFVLDLARSLPIVHTDGFAAAPTKH